MHVKAFSHPPVHIFQQQGDTAVITRRYSSSLPLFLWASLLPLSCVLGIMSAFQKRREKNDIPHFWCGCVIFRSVLPWVGSELRLSRGIQVYPCQVKGNSFIHYSELHCISQIPIKPLQCYCFSMIFQNAWSPYIIFFSDYNFFKTGNSIMQR